MISTKRLLWLTTRGGRNENDVKYNENGWPFIEMYKRGGMVPVYIPEDKDIHLWVEKHPNGMINHVHGTNSNWKENRFISKKLRKI